MTRSLTRTSLRAAIVSITLVFGVAGPRLSAGDSAASIETTVRLTAVNKSLLEVLQVLSKDAGCSIELDPALEDRQVTIYAEKTTVASVLSDMCELYGWTWHVKPDSQIVVERKKPRRPKQLEDVGPSISSALPADVRRFFGVGVNPKDMLTPRAPKTYNYDDPAEELRDQVVAKIDLIIDELQMELFASLKPTILDGRKMPFSKLTETQRQLLVEIICLKYLSKINLSLLAGDLPIYARQPNLAEISIGPGEQIAVSVTTQQGDIRKRSGFAVPLEEPKPIP